MFSSHFEKVHVVEFHSCPGPQPPALTDTGLVSEVDSDGTIHLEHPGIRQDTLSDHTLHAHTHTA